MMMMEHQQQSCWCIIDEVHGSVMVYDARNNGK